MDKVYRIDLDVLKGIAIIAVVLFHLGIVKSGFLGVDVFLVINGFLIIPSICKKVSSGQFSYFEFLKGRVKRLWPLILLSTLVCLVVGYIGMLPDDYENLSESVVASNLFSENILLSITTKDYWNVTNDYNPLMHLWYVGVIFQFYLFFPLVIMLTNKLGGGGKKYPIIISCILLLSIVLYLLPCFDDGTKFYYLPFRLFEFLLGGICGLLTIKVSAKHNVYYSIVTLLVIVLFSSVVLLDVNTIGTDVLKVGRTDLAQEITLLLPKWIMLLSTVLLTAIVVTLGNNLAIKKNGVLALLGKRSYSVYIWHQPLIAFYRYFVTTKITLGAILIFLLLLIVVTEFSYRFVEKVFSKYKHSLSITVIFAILITACASYIYVRAGVVRDVPELNIYSRDVHRGMHAAYVDRIYKYDIDFPKNGKINVLVEGISYGRDMANVLLESSYADSINLSYVFRWDSQYVNRIKAADFIFTFRSRKDVPEYVINNMNDHCKLLGIGTKNYGNSNGIIYTKRRSPDYFHQVVEIHPWYRNKNDEWKLSWGNNYVDFIEPAMTDANHVRIFTDNNKFISQDCYHLTQSGAQWYASKFDFTKIFK